MSLKRDMLVEAGITDKSVIDNIMQAYGAGIENAKSQAKSELQAQFDTYKTENEANLAQVKKTNAVALALKDVGAYNSEDLMKFIDLDKIELGEDGKPVLEETINGLKESSPYLFQAQSEPQSPNFTVPGNPAADAGQDISAEDKALFEGFDSV